MIDILQNKLESYCIELGIPIHESSILVSFSGGMDSTVLVSLMVELKALHGFALNTVHFNHQVHDKADKMENFCKSFANEYNINHYSQNFIFDKLDNFEARAREKRYFALEMLANDKNCHFIFTAHHRDDQFETLLMKKIDQSDWISQIGIREKLGKVRRPLLYIDKDIIRKFAVKKRLNWIEDPTNRDLSIRRNEIRILTLPNAIKANPQLPQELLETAFENKLRFKSVLTNFSKNKKYLIKKASPHYLSIFLERIKELKLEELKIFVYWCTKSYFQKTISQYNGGFWSEFKQFLQRSKTGSDFEIGYVTFIKNRNELILISNFTSIKKEPGKIQLTHNQKWYNTYFKIREEEKYIYSSNKNQISIPWNLYNEGMYLRRCIRGDKIKSATSKKHLLISDLFINNKLSKYNKLTQPLVVDKLDRIIWIPGLAHGYLEHGSKQINSRLIQWVQK